MSTFHDCRHPDGRDAGLREAVEALRRGELVVLPTDTVYGVAADAFDADAVAALLAAKGRDRTMPPPVLVHDARSVDALVERSGSAASSSVDDLAEAFWPGGLTLVCWAQGSLRWDLGDTGGTVAVRVPDDELARALLAESGPLAVSSANLTGLAPGESAAEVRDQLGEAVACYLEDGARDGGTPSTVLDLTGPRPEVLRQGVVSVEELRRVVPDVRTARPSAPPVDPAGRAALTAPDEPSGSAPAEPSPSEGGDGAQETGTRETGAQETGTQETGTQETGTQETGTQETGTQETGTQETGTQETGAQETGAQETGAQETGAQETGAQETGTRDEGSGAPPDVR